VIISVGYRVKSKRGTQFRIWAIQVLKDYLLKGQIVNQRIERLEHKVGNIEEKIDFFIRTVLSPVEGIFYQGQIFDAYVFSSDLIKAVRKRIVLLDNYVEIAKIKSFILLRFATNDNHFTHLDKMVYDSVSIILASQYRPINHIIEILPVLYGRLVVLV
jgi:hypothetical protein